MPEAAVDPAVLRELRRERRTRRLAGVEWFEALYRVYLVGFVGAFVVLLLSSAIGGDPVSDAVVDDVERYGPAAVGFVVAGVIALGLRSGSRGGPLALEPAEVRHVLLAPIDRRRALLGPALRQVRFGMFVGAVVGAVVGQLASRRLPGTLLPWVASVGAAGLLAAVVALGAGYLAAGVRLPRLAASLLGAALLAWAAADLAGIVPAPTTFVGGLAIWPLGVDLVDLLAAPLALAVLAAGVWALGRASVEAAERRTGLIGQLRFAVTVQDLRTALVLRRMLDQERPRRRPWLTLHRSSRWPVWRRGWRGYLRFPAARLTRMVVLTVGAAVAFQFAYHHAHPAFVVGGLALYLVGLDAIEPLAQEIDQADRASTVPHDRGELLTRHLTAIAAVLVPFAVLGTAVGFALNRTSLALAVVAISCLPAVWTAAAGAIVSVAMGAPNPMSPTQDMLPPEIAGVRVVMRAAWPVLLAVLGGLPVLFASLASENGGSEPAAALQGAMFGALVITGVATWLRHGDRARQWWRDVLEQGEQARAASAKQRVT